MVNDDVTVRDPFWRSDAPAPGENTWRKPDSKARQRMCPAMSQQRSDIGNEAAPQKFIRLTGCRDVRRARATAPVSPALVPRG